MGDIVVVIFGKQICHISHVGKFRKTGILANSKNICSKVFICPKSKKYTQITTKQHIHVVCYIRRKRIRSLFLRYNVYF